MTPRPPRSKLLDRAALAERFRGRPGVVFTNGCFDILHAGHVTYLEQARALGDALVVGVNTDASARRLAKGTGRPVVDERSRALVVAALESVDAVCLFDEDTPAALVAALVPSVLVKGGDYAVEDVAGRETVEGAGGRVEIIPLVEGHSSSAIVTKIREAKEP